MSECSSALLCALALVVLGAMATVAAASGTSSTTNLSHTLPASSNFTCPPNIGLPMGDINILVVTDIHGWIAGQHARHEPQLNVDFGHLVSYFERLKECSAVAKNGGGDWFLLFNGDFMDGTGLSMVPPVYLAPLLQDVPFSALNVGNHELYFNEVVDFMMKPADGGGFISSWGGAYLASNVDYVNQEGNAMTQNSTVQPFGNRFTYLYGSNTNATILTFGFLYNFEGNCNHTLVRQVEDVLQESWFVDVLGESELYDAIIVLAHMDAVDPLVYTILEAIRSHVGPTMRIQFLTGHSHRRHYEVLDPFATSLEAGRYMDTIGFASFPVLSTVESSREFAAWHDGEDLPLLFQHEFLNASLEVLTTTAFRGSPGEDFSTPQGRALSAKMQKTQRDLGLLEVVTKCAPQDYELAKPLNDTSSLWWLYVNEVIPTTLFPRLGMEDEEETAIPIFIQGTGALRYSLLGPKVVVDDIIAVSPFENSIFQVGSRLTSQALNEVFRGLQVDAVAMKWESVGLVNFGVAGERPDSTIREDDDKLYNLYTTKFHVGQVYDQVQNTTIAKDGADQNSPRPVYTNPLKRSKPLGTTRLWMEFVRGQWKCPQPDAPTPDRENPLLMIAVSLHDNESIPSRLATISAVFVILLVALESVRRRRTVIAQQLGDYTRCIGERSPLLPNISYALNS